MQVLPLAPADQRMRAAARTETLQPFRGLGRKLAAAIDKQAAPTFFVFPVPQNPNKRPANFDRHSFAARASHFSSEIRQISWKRTTWSLKTSNLPK